MSENSSYKQVSNFLNKMELLGVSYYINVTDITRSEMVYLISKGWELSINYNNINMSFLHILCKNWEV